MQTSSSPSTRTENNDENPKKRKARKVVELGRGTSPYRLNPGVQLTIDENDYLIVNEILEGETLCLELHEFVEVDRRDQERRVSKIQGHYFDSGRIKFRSVPDSIGRLTNLAILDLSASTFDELPASIGELKNLKELYLRRTERLIELPEDIGNLASLETLDLSGNELIESLPRSVGRLKNLLHLYLCNMKSLSEIPEEIGNLSRLKVLDIGMTVIASLPVSMKRLTGLMHFQFLPIFIDDNFLWMLVQHCPLLGSFGWHQRRSKRLNHALARNRARTRTPFESRGMKESDSNISKLWPRMLANATRAFDRYELCHPGSGITVTSSGRIPQPDAVHQLLVDGKESFLRVLLRSQKRH